MLILQNLFEFVKYFFQKFFDIFNLILRFQQLFRLPQSVCFVKNFFESFELRSLFAQAATFNKLPHFTATVKCFFLSLSGTVFTAPTALLEYQTVRQKSTLFLALCLFFLKRLYFSLIFGSFSTVSLIYTIFTISCTYYSLHFLLPSSSFLTTVCLLPLLREKERDSPLSFYALCTSSCFSAAIPAEAAHPARQHLWSAAAA